MTSVTLAVTGMHCGGCALSVEQALRLVPGVTRARVRFEDQRAIVDMDDAATREADLVAAVRVAGFGASILRDV